MKKIGNVHPLVTVFGVIVGLQLFGFMGFIFGPLIGAGLYQFNHAFPLIASAVLVGLLAVYAWRVTSKQPLPEG